MPASATPAVAPPTPRATPSLAATAEPIRLDWVHGRLPQGLVACEAGCPPWGFWPVFGGLAIGFGTGDGKSDGSGPVRLLWTADGTRWQAISAPKGLLEGWLQSDGTDTGAFAYAADGDRMRLWRTVDRGRTWRQVTGVTDWPEYLQLAAGAGRFLATSQDSDPLRLFVSDDGWAWTEVVPLPSNFVGSIRSTDTNGGWQVDLQGDAAGFVADVGGPGEREWFTTSPDGRTWTPPRELAPYCATLYRVLSGFVRFSSGDDCDRDQSEILTSTDGTTWQSRGLVDARWDGPELLPVGFVVTRWIVDETDDSGISEAGWLAYSYSRDGVTWSDLGKVPGKNTRFDALGSDRVFAFGSYFGGSSGDSSCWSAELPRP
jgi:hypothetical protein